MRYTIAAFNATFVRGSSEYFSLSHTHTLSIYLTTHCDCRCIVRNHPLTGSKSLWSFIEKALTFPLAKVSPQHSHDPRREWIYPSPSPPPPPPPSTSFQVILVYQRRARSELYLSRTGYRVFDCRESRCPPRSPLSPALYHFTAISGIILRPWTTLHSTPRGREKFDGIGSCLKQRAWPRRERKRERENERSLCDLSSLVISWVSHCEEFTWPGCRVVQSTRLFFSGRADNSLVCTRASFPLAWERTIVT